MGPYVVISRESGVTASEVAQCVAELLEWDVLDRNTIYLMADQSGIPADHLDYVDRATWDEGRDFGQATYMRCLGELVLQAAERGRAVIAGRGAEFYLPAAKGLFVLMTAPVDFRIRETLLSRDCTPAEAKRLVDIREQRQALVSKYLPDLSQPHSPAYDLVINTEKLKSECAAKLIVTAALNWMQSSPLEAEPEPTLE